jgi:pimeloyl-ACP methyl ester carboxylesterase
MKTHKQLLLDNGRKIGIAEYGDPNGTPLFFFHGCPSSRLQAQMTDDVGKQMNIRIISVDRPGYGLSDFQKDRTLLDWAKDINDIADRLRIKKFAVLGISGGGPYAAACAYAIPDRLTKIGIVVGIAPMNIPHIQKALPVAHRIALRYAKLHSLFIHILTSIQANEFVLTHMSSFYLSQADRKILTKAWKEDLIKNRAEAFRQGRHGVKKDLQLYIHDWNFSLQDITKHVYLWYGDSDKSVPNVMADYYASEIKKNTFTVYPNAGHYLFRTHIKAILQALL